MDENVGVEWAQQVAARGWPSKDAPVAQRRAAYEELEAAYYALAEDAATNGYIERSKSYSDLADRAYQLAVEGLGPEERR